MPSREEIEEKRAQSNKIREIYRHDEMSNKVLQADKRLQANVGDPARDAELSKPTSMSGRISFKDMGSNVRDQKIADDEKVEAQKVFNNEKNKIAVMDNTLKRNIINNHGNNTILEMDNVATLKYYPTNESNLQIYENVMDLMTNILGTDIPHDIITGTTDSLIRSIKNVSKEDSLSEVISNNKKTLEDDLGYSIDNSIFNTMIDFIKNISDFDEGNDTTNNKNKVVSILANESDNEENEEQTTLQQELMLEEDNEEEEEEEEENVVDPPKNRSQLDENLLFNKEDIIKIDDINSEDNTFPIYLINEKYIYSILRTNLSSNDEVLLNSTTTKIIDALRLSEETTDAFSENIQSILNSKFNDEDNALLPFFEKNRVKLLWGIKLSECKSNEIPRLLNTMELNGLHELVHEYKIKDTQKEKRLFEHEEEMDDTESNSNKKLKVDQKNSKIPEVIDLEKMKFDRRSRLLTVSKVTLPEGSFKKVKSSYDEIHIPAPESPTIDYDLVPISVLPEWARGAFPSNETETLNAIQSKVFPTAFETDSNILLCAPTGGGKTNVALLTVLRALSHFYNPSTKKFNLKNFKVVYVAPLKALVQEQVREFQRRLIHLGIKVSELTGDSRLNKQEISQTHIIVSTPEKWDIVTRKLDDSSFAQLVSLIIIDEVHLLHDSRGPVLENIVARTLSSKYLVEKPRLVALSATLPNFEDVAKFLRVPKEGLFHFDSSYRPCPLTQQFCGVREQNSLKKMTAMNEACFDKVLESLTDSNQVIVFVHSRKETARTANWLRNKFIESDNQAKLNNNEQGAKDILKAESENIQNPNLKKLIEHGIGIHHAGLSREDRSLSEDLFADGLLRILVSTATLAWGVNLPAHTVIIKGTDVYSPESGTWEQLSPQDILQMLGRAGRPRYDTHGEGIIITNQTDVQYYLAVLNQQLPIESQMISHLTDSINAEIVSGLIKNRNDAVRWLSYTYLYVRMLISPELYKVNLDNEENELAAESFITRLLHTAFSILADQQLILYDEGTGGVESTELGKIASYFYIRPTSISRYNNELTKYSTTIDLFRIFALSDEFRYIAIRQEERKELKELASKAPIPIKEDINDPLTKVNILLQAYISKVSFDGFALNADMVFIHQSAGRLLRAMYELCLKKNWAIPTKHLLNLCKSVEWRMWPTNSPLRQFSKCPSEIIRRAESATLPWTEYLKLTSPTDVSTLIRAENYSKLVFDLIQRFPKISLKCVLQPLTPSLISFDLEFLPTWIWDSKLHGYGEAFTILVEDTDGRDIIFKDSVIIRREHINEEQYLNFTIQLTPSQQKTLPPTFYVTILSEKWWHCQYKIAAILDELQLPKKFPSSSHLDPQKVVDVSALENEEFQNLVEFEKFNSIQSDVFDTLYNSNENVLVACSKRSGKSDMALLSILNHWRQNKGRAVFISPSQKKIDQLYRCWSEKLEGVAGGKVINKLDNDLNMNIRKLSQSHLLFGTPKDFDILSRRWRKRKNIQRIELVIFDDIHEISGATVGPIYENVISRMVFVRHQLENDLRIVGLGLCLTNGRDLGEWIGARKNCIFNYSPDARITPIEIHLQSFPNSEYNFATSQMIRAAFETSMQKVSDTGTIVYLDTRASCINVAITFINYAHASSWDILGAEEDQMEIYSKKLVDPALGKCLKNGIGVMYKDMDRKDEKIIMNLYECGALTFLFLTNDLYHALPKTDLVIILGTHYYDINQHRYSNYSANNVVEMIGNTQPLHKYQPGRAVIYTSENRKHYYKKFLSESVPTESFMSYYLHDAFVHEISNSIIENKQDCIDWITYTYFYRRIHANPSFYGVKDTSAYGISEYLTKLVEATLNDLKQAKLIDIEEIDNEDGDSSEECSSDKILPLNGCLIASHYDISSSTMHRFSSSLDKTSTLRDILEALSAAAEYEEITIRKDDFSKLLKLEKSLPMNFFGERSMYSASYKVFILLQAYFSRIHLPFELSQDLRFILSKSVDLINAIVDLLSGEGQLNVTTAMDMSQMLVQGVWDVDSPLRQIPFFDNSILDKCKALNVETVYDVMALEDKERETILTMGNDKLVQVANFINNYPNIELSYSLNSEQFMVDDSIEVEITLRRDDEPETLEVTSEKFPEKKSECWWVFIGDVSRHELYAIRKTTLSEESQSLNLSFELSTSGKHDLTIWAVCDSYMDADKEVSFTLEVK